MNETAPDPDETPPPSDHEGQATRRVGRLHLSLATMMMFVLMAAAASALFGKISEHAEPFVNGWKTDVPILFLLAIGLTAIALASWKEHTAVQAMLQVTIACFGCLVLIWIGEAGFGHALRYWFQGTFALTVSLPLLGRRFVKSEMPRGPRRDWWKKTCEAIFFSFLNIILVTAGGLFQVMIAELAPALVVK